MIDIPKKIVDVDLSRGEISYKEVSEETIREVLGGFGFNTRLLYREMRRGAALAPENILALSLGLLTGTEAPSSSRIHLNARSPQSGLMASSNAGGFFGAKLRRLGIFSIILRGRAEHPVYLSLTQGDVELRDASGLWGLSTGETDGKIREELNDPKSEILSIGPAGENLVPYACAMLGSDHSAGRTGIGAVMGSKHLKAIAVTGKIDEAGRSGRTDDATRELIKNYLKNIKANESRYRDFSERGSAGDILEAHEMGTLGTKNYRETQFSAAENIDGRNLTSLELKKKSCHRCPVHCKAVLELKTGRFKDYSGSRPEFETIMSLGSLCGLEDPETVVYLSNLCNELGLDTVSAGSVLAFAMDLYNRGIITEEDTGGIAVPWGDGEVMEKLLRMIAKREGFGKVLSGGVARAAQTLGRGAEKYAYHVKGVEIYGTDPRGMMGIALSYAVSLRGADFTSVYPIQELRYTPEQGKAEYGTEKAVDPKAVEGKGRLVRHSMIVSAVMDSLGLCKVPLLSIMGDFTLKNEASLIKGLTGLEITEKQLFTIGERIINMQKLFNLRFGGDKKGDTLPETFLLEPIAKGPSQGRVVDLAPMVADFYQAMNWDEEGNPLPEEIRKLGLDPPDKQEKIQPKGGPKAIE